MFDNSEKTVLKKLLEREIDLYQDELCDIDLDGEYNMRHSELSSKIDFLRGIQDKLR